MEIKIGSDDLWHPHLHIIADSKYIPHGLLLDACRTAFASECSVDIRPIQDPKRCTDYVSKYLAKGCNDEEHLSRDHAKADELYIAMYRAKTCWIWGKTAPRPPKPERVREPAADWQSIIPYGQIMLGIKTKNQEVLYMLEAAKAPIKSMRNYIRKLGGVP